MACSQALFFFFFVRHFDFWSNVCVCLFTVLVLLVSVFLFSLDSAFLSGVSVSPTCYFKPPSSSPPFMGPASPAVRNSVHNPNCPIQQCPLPSYINPPSPLSSPTWNSSYLSVSRLVLPNDTVLFLLFFYLHLFFCFFQLIKCNY